MLWSGNRMSISDNTRAGGSLERDIEQAIIALKKGAHLLKYGRRGKPKFCPFRLANDESVLIWFSGKEEKQLKLSDVSRIISGQRTPIFQRYPRPEKEYQSFSLIYNDRSLDLICKDKEEAEVWFSGLKALILRSHRRNRRIESRSEGISSGATSPRTYTRRSSPLHSAFGNGEGLPKDCVDKVSLYGPYDSPPKNGFEKALSDVILYAVPPKGLYTSDPPSGPVSILSGGSDGLHSHTKGMGVDAFRVSLSSAVSSSSHGSGHDDGDSLGDVYIWGEGTGDGIIGGGMHRVGSCSEPKMDSSLPKALESAVVLDVHNIACGVRHASLVTKQGEVFSWGEEFKGRLGHGVDSDVLQPKLIDALSNISIELVASGEYHSCAVSLNGDLYTWGHGHFGILGHGNEVSHWVPKRVEEPLCGIHISSVSCGPWHTAVVTSAGQLFTFGDGTFGVLGHGDRLSVLRPREVESLKGLRTIRAACGVWHTAAVVEVMVGSSNSSNYSSGKLFTWGDGDKYRLGHGDKESKLVPTCVAALVEPNFCQVACGDSLTVALTTSGQVYVMGSQVYGQLGNPQADGKLPCRVEGKLANCLVEEISCGAYHVAALTSRTEVYTWGKGANGRLGHGDAESRNVPTLVEALKDKQVKSVVCGSSFTAAICLHKWVSGLDQSICSGCRQPFNFKRKRHNCYNCGLVFCHSCSNKKSLRASMAPNPNKSYRVCENCFNKLKKAIEIDASSHSSMSKRGSMNVGKNNLADKDDRMDTKSRSQLTRLSTVDSFKQTEPQFTKRNKKLEFSSSLVSPTPNGGSQQDHNNMSKSLNPIFGSSKKYFSASVPGSRIVSRATSPISRQASPPRSTTPTPTLGGLMSPKLALDNEKATNDSLKQEVINLRAQVDNLTRKAQQQELELERTIKQLKEAIAIAGEETAKCKVAKEVIKSLTAQLKEMAEKLPVGSARNIKSSLLNSFESSPNQLLGAADAVNGQLHVENLEHYESKNLILPNGSSTTSTNDLVETRQGKAEATHNGHNKTKEENDPHNENEWVEHDEPGVYITLSSLPGGFKDLKRVRFSRKRFSEKQAEQWWSENRTRVYEQYNIRILDKSSVGAGSEDMPH